MRSFFSDEFHDALRRFVKAGDDMQQRRLTAARRPNDAEELSIAHFEIDAAQSASLSLPRRELFG